MVSARVSVFRLLLILSSLSRRYVASSSINIDGSRTLRPQDISVPKTLRHHIIGAEKSEHFGTEVSRAGPKCPVAKVSGNHIDVLFSFDFFGPQNGSPMVTNVVLLVIVLLGFLLLSDFQGTKSVLFLISQPIIIKLRLQIGDSIHDFCTVSDFQVKS